MFRKIPLEGWVVILVYSVVRFLCMSGYPRQLLYARFTYRYAESAVSLALAFSRHHPQFLDPYNPSGRL